MLITVMKPVRYLLYYIYRILKSSHNYTIYENYRQKYKLNSTIRFNGSNIALYGNGKIIIGDNTYIGDGSSIQSIDGMTVKIGRNCAISHNVRIYTSNYDASEIINSHSKTRIKHGDVYIGDNCWIGVNVLITEDVSIGSNVVIGGNSVVVNNIPSNCVVGGIPAKIIKTND